MSFFDSFQSDGMSNGKSPSPDQINLIGQDTTIEGSLESTDGIRVSGTVRGELRTQERVVIAEQGMIEGDVFAENAEVAGTIKGDMSVEGTLVLRGSALIRGDITTDKLVIEEGARFVGECHMQGIGDDGSVEEPVSSASDVIGEQDRS